MSVDGYDGAMYWRPITKTGLGLKRLGLKPLKPGPGQSHEESPGQSWSLKHHEQFRAETSSGLAPMLGPDEMSRNQVQTGLTRPGSRYARTRPSLTSTQKGPVRPQLTVTEIVSTDNKCGVSSPPVQIASLFKVLSFIYYGLNSYTLTEIW